MAAVRLVKVQKSYGDTPVLRDIDLEVHDGEFMVFVGPSGCGKSTLLRTIAGLEDVTAGELRIGERVVNDVPPAERGIAMVFQSYALYPHMSLFDNMAFGLKLAKVPKAEIEAAVNRAAKMLHIEHLLQRRPKDLSGGQRQRVAIGRAIVRQPEVFLFDEPLSNLDTALRVKMRYEFAKLHEQFKTTMVYVTHDQVEAMTLADRIVVLRAGVIEQVGTPLELYNDPQNLFVAGFIGSPRMNFLPGTITGSNGGTVDVRLDAGLDLSAAIASKAPPSGKVTLGVRPEDITVAMPDAAMVTGDVQIAEHLGGETFVYVSLPSGQTVTVEVQGQANIRPGERIGLSFADSAFHLFDASERVIPRRKATNTASPQPAAASIGT